MEENKIEKLIKEESSESPESTESSETKEKSEDYVEITEKLKSDNESVTESLSESFWDKYKIYLFGVVIIALIYVGYLYFYVYAPSLPEPTRPVTPFYDSTFIGTVNKEMKEVVPNLMEETVPLLRTGLNETVPHLRTGLNEVVSQVASSVPLPCGNVIASSTGKTGST